MQQITVIVRDNFAPSSDPLIYSVAAETLDYDTVLAAVKIERLKELGGDDDSDLDDLDLDLLFAFPGYLETVADWRQ
jgi:hypothetical protein